MKEPLVISFSGGQTSAYMTYLLTHTHLYDNYEKYVVFANTGCEHDGTLDFVNECDKLWGLNVIWLEAKVNPEKGKGTRHKIVDYQSASRDGEPYLDVSRKYGVPNVARPSCTRELKQAPIASRCRETFGKAFVKTAIGIRADEERRYNLKNAEARNLIYPLLHDIPTDKEDVDLFFETAPIRLDLPNYLGNCVWCFKKSFKKIGLAHIECPEYFEVQRKVQEIEPNYPMYRGSRRLIDVLNIADVVEWDFYDPCNESCELF